MSKTEPSVLKVSVSKFKSNAVDFFRNARHANVTYIVLWHNKPHAVVIPNEDYEELLAFRKAAAEAQDEESPP